MAQTIEKACIGCPAVLICISTIPTEVLVCPDCQRAQLRYDRADTTAVRGPITEMIHQLEAMSIEVNRNCPKLPANGETSEGWDRSDFSVQCDECFKEKYNGELGGPSHYDDP